MREPFKKAVKKELGRLLIEEGLISNGQLEEALKVQKETGMLIGKCLVKLKFVTPKDILNAMMVQYGFPYLPLRNYTIDRSVLKHVPQEIARKNELIPVDKIGNILTLAISNPLNIKIIQELEEKTGFKVEVFISTTQEILEAIDNNYTASEEKKDEET